VAIPSASSRCPPQQAIDYALTSASFFFYAMPAFLLGTLLIIYFSFDLNWFPVSPPQDAPPWAVITDPLVRAPARHTVRHHGGLVQRYMRSSMMDALAEDYVRTARAKGPATGACSTATPCATPSSR